MWQAIESGRKTHSLRSHCKIVYDSFQVDFVEPAQNYVHLKLIPRIDYTKPRGFAKNKDNVSIKYITVVLPPL